MNQSTYLRFELLRTLRNRRFLFFSLAFPLIIFLGFASANRHATLNGIGFPLYFMAGMASYGAMTGIIAAGARISLERQIGWTRQLRITPLTTRRYFQAKILCGYLSVCLTLILLYLAGTSLGVRLTASHWLEMTGLILVGVIPFAVIGIMFGHLLKPDSMGPAIGGLTAVFAIFGGAWGPVASGGEFLKIVKCLPSYWIVQSGKVASGGAGWPRQAWIVLIIWTLVATRLAILAYRKDTTRVA